MIRLPPPTRSAPHAVRLRAVSLAGGIGLLGLCALAASPARAAAEEPVVLRSGAWLGACDNGGDCRVFGFSDDDGAVLLLRLPRGREPTGTLLVRLDRAAARPGSVRLQMGRRGPVVSLALPVDAAEQARAVLEPAALRVLMPALRQTGRVSVATSGRGGLRDVLRLNGAAAVLDWVGHAQRRAPEVPPRWPDAAAPDQAVPPDQTPPPAVASLSAVRACAAQDAGQPGRGATGSGLSGRSVLWRISCGSGNFSQDSLFVVADGRSAVVAAFQSPPQFPLRAPGVLVNAEQDAPGVLVATEPARGLNDCGDVRRYRWDGRRFRLETAQLMPACHGLAVEDWPVVYRTGPAR